MGQENSVQIMQFSPQEPQSLQRIEEKLKAQVRQQAAVADLGLQALASNNLTELMHDAVRCVAETLELEFSKVLELLPDGNNLILRAGVGWQDGWIGHGLVDAGTETQAGYTLLSTEPVIIEDWRIETRFKPSQLFQTHQVVSGMSVVIAGREQPFGILGAYTAEKRIFTNDEIYFLQSVANVLAMAIERTRTEEALRQQTDLIELSDEPILVWDFDNGIIFWNSGCEQLYGFSRQEAMGQVSHRLLQTVHPIPVDQFKALLEREGQWAGEIMHTTRDGRQVMVDSRQMLVHNASGRRLVLETSRDITARKQAEQALHETNTILQAVIEGTADAIFVKDLQGRYLIINSAGAGAVGKSVDEMMGRTDLEVLPSEMARTVQEEDRRVMSDGQTKTFETTINSASGRRVYHSVKTPYRDEHNAIIGVIGIAREITNRKRAEVSQRILAEAGKILGSSMDYNTRLATVAQLAVPQLADWCVVDVIEGEAIHQVAVAHADPAKVALVNEWRSRYPLDWDASTGVPHVLRTGQAELYPEISEAMVEASTVNAEQRRLLTELELKSAMIVPMNTRGRTLGAITFISAESGRRYDELDLALAEELGQRAATAIDNVRSYKAEQEARREAEFTTQRIASLQAVTAALSEAVTPTQVATVILEKGLAALGADSGVIVLLDPSGENLEILHYFGYPAEGVDSWRSFPLSTPAPLAETVRTGEPIFIETMEELQTRYPDFVRQRISGHLSMVSLPLTIEGQLRGGIGLSFNSSQTFNAKDRSFMVVLARQCSQALERARLYEAERSARAEAEAAQQRLAILAETRERNRMAQELHDTVAQALGYLNLKIATTISLLGDDQNDRVEANLHEVKNIVAETYTDVREEIFNLRANAFEGLSFLELLDKYIDKYRKFYNLDIQLILQVDESLLLFPAEVGSQIIRTIQEALINVRKHAQVNRAIIRFGRHDNEMRISVEDEGRGFDPIQRSTATSSFGLQIMRERVESIGGSLEIDSAPSQGTRIILHYPLA